MMRRRRCDDSPIGSTRSVHLGWGYHDRDEFLCAAAQFIDKGLARNELVQFVADGSPKELRSALTNAGVRHDPGVRVTSAVEFYPTSAGGVLDPDAAIAGLHEAARQAIDEGYTGLCIVGDATALVRHPEGRNAFARYEFLADRAIAGLPVTAMCAFDVTALGQDAAELVCLHPEVGESVTDFRVHAAEGVSFAIDGEIDAASAGLFDDTLRRVWPLIGGSDDVVIDVGTLRFVDHNVLLGLDERAGRGGRRVVLRDAGPLVRRLVDLVRPPHTVVESAA